MPTNNQDPERVKPRHAKLGDVTVHQFSNYGTARDSRMLLEKPSLNWPSPGGRTADQAEEFLADLEKAIALAREWDKDTGKELTRD